MKYILLIITYIYISISMYGQKQDKTTPLIGAYYFDGWAGQNSNKTDSWAKNAPTHLTQRMVNEFSNRQPLWGWRDDSLSLMEKQIDLAATNGIDFFIFCWYWSNGKGPINIKGIENQPLHTSLNLFMKARNKHKMKFALLVANHSGAEIVGEKNGIDAVNYWSKNYLNDPQYMKFDNKPLVVFFDNGINSLIPSMNSIAINNGFNGLITVSNGYMPKFKSFDYVSWYNMRADEPGYAQERKYTQLISFIEMIWKQVPASVPMIPTVMTGWDSRPWETKKQGIYYTGATPQLFEEQLIKAIKEANRHPSLHPKMVFIYAWNELGEGGYLVPTKGDPKTSFLKKINSAKKKSKK
ncbi:MAG: glycoside hydrolase family 99-like domain-containing protein [Dysgonomonas sp.]